MVYAEIESDASRFFTEKNLKKYFYDTIYKISISKINNRIKVRLFGTSSSQDAKNSINHLCNDIIKMGYDLSWQVKEIKEEDIPKPITWEELKNILLEIENQNKDIYVNIEENYNPIAINSIKTFKNYNNPVIIGKKDKKTFSCSKLVNAIRLIDNNKEIAILDKDKNYSTVYQILSDEKSIILLNGYTNEVPIFWSL